jgi:extracellular elastinolytic metalloproteinase
MRFTLLRRAALVAAAFGALALPASSFGIANIYPQDDALPDYDVRSGKLAPTRAQKAALKRLGARVTWNQYGTPASLSKRGKFLSGKIKGQTAVQAARRWLYRNRVLFGLKGVDKLELVSDSKLAFSRGHAVNFRQVFDGLAAADGGLVTIGITGTARKGWRVSFVSSSLTKDSALSGRGNLSAEQAWVKSAVSSGESYSVANVRDSKAARGWRHLAVAGLSELQMVKRVAFPTIRNGVVPAFESIVLKSKDAVGYRVIVDARTGALLARQSLVQNFARGEQARPQTRQATPQARQVTVIPLTGTIAADGGCVTHPAFTVGAGVRALIGKVDATSSQLNDVILELLKGTTVLIHADTLYTPESFRYSPAGGVPPGSDYAVRVCDFADGVPWAAPPTYTGTLTIDDSAAPPAYWARWKVFPANPPLHVLPGDPWNHPDTDTREVWCWRAADGCDKVVGNLASRSPWDHDVKTNVPTYTTKGNNTWSRTSWNDPNAPSPPAFSPVSNPARDYSFTWTNSWNNDDCEPTPNGPPGSTWDDSAASANLFVAHNRMHDWAYWLGFTEVNFNAQDSNFGLTETWQESDPLLGNVQAGALIPGVRDNANMFTLPDGASSVTNMYFWQPFAGSFYAPCVDGDYDMGVIGHEYGHMIENRMLGKGANRVGHHAGAMGESFGDMNGMEYQNENGFVPTGDENRYAVGTYDTGNKLRAIRNYGMNYPTSGSDPTPGKQLLTNALNFSDMGYDLTGPTPTSSNQVHANGEIWSKVNFGIRQLLADKYDDDFPVDDEDLQASCAEGELPPQNCPGNRRWFTLYYDAMLLAPAASSMLQMRDAMIAADLTRFGGANADELWLGFARGGMGEGATSTNNSLANTSNVEPDNDPTPSFRSPEHRNAEVRFRARSTDGDVIDNARIFVGHYEARVSPIADTNPATTGLNLDDVAEFAPGTYELLVQAPGYGFLRSQRTFHKSENPVIEFRMPKNYASLTNGATASGDANVVFPDQQPIAGQPSIIPVTQQQVLNMLIDDTERTNWTAAGTITGGTPTTGGNLSVAGKQVTVDLAGTKAVNVKHIQVSSMLRSGVVAIPALANASQNRFTALRQFEVWACNAEKDNCSTSAGFDHVYTSRDDAFPGDPPRPVAPHMILRGFDIPNVKATHLRLVAVTSQCTGGPLFQGEQDADPTNNTDCDSNVLAGASRSFVRAAEFQVFSDEGSVKKRH